MPIRERFQLDKVDGARIGRFDNGFNTTFVIYRIGNTLIDAGPSNQWQFVRAFADERPVDALLLTHHHEDHSGNAAAIAKRHNITPYAPALSDRKLSAGFRIPPIQRWYWGLPVPVETQPLPAQMTLADGTTIQVIHTPGHAKDLHCLYLPDEGWLFSADLYIARRLKLLRVDENLTDMIHSITRVLTLDFDVIFCAHRGTIKDGKQRLTDKRNNLLAFCEQAQTHHAQGLAVDQIVAKMLGPDALLTKLTNYNFSKRNLVTQALRFPLEPS